MKRIHKRKLKNIGIILLVISLVIMSFIGLGGVHAIYALEKDQVDIVVKVDPGIKDLEVDIVQKVDLVKEVRTVKEIDFNELESVEDTVIEEPVKELTIADVNTIEEKIRVACDIHSVPYDIAMAIARLETGHFKSNAYKNKNNPGGLSRNEKPMSFDTIDDGVEAFVSNLNRNYISKGLNTPEKIGKKYCPVNPKWPGLVKSLMKYES